MTLRQINRRLDVSRVNIERALVNINEYRRCAHSGNHLAA